MHTTTMLRDRITRHRPALVRLNAAPNNQPRAGWDSRPTWDNRGGGWDSRPGWDNI